MIDPVDLQTFLSKIEGGANAVDLLKIGEKHYQQSIPPGSKGNKYGSNFRIALDMEDCLDRWYGGYYSDWACGGQWNRAYQFVQLLVNAFKNAHIEIIAFFDGTLKKNKKINSERNDFRQKTLSVLKHIRMMGTPPPKIWWLPPSGIRTTLRNALRSINIQVAQTVNDHTMEIVEYFYEQKLDALLGLHPDYIIANVSRYFSSHDLRLSYKGALETKEFMVTKLLASLSLTADHLPFVAVFLGGYILIDKEMLIKIYDKLKIDVNLDYEARLRKIAEIIRNSPTTDIDEFIKHLNLADYEKEIKESVEYYQRKGKFSFKNKIIGKKRGAGIIIGGVGNEHKAVTIIEQPAVPFASETNENDEMARKILNDVNNLVNDETTNVLNDEKSTKESNQQQQGGGDGPTKDESAATPATTAVTVVKKPAFVYTLPAEVLKTALNRHQRGMMDSRIYQLLTRKEIILPQILEDEKYREVPSVHHFYRPARQMIYAIIFNLYHQKYLCTKQQQQLQHQNASGGDTGKKSDNRKDAIGAGLVFKMPDVQVSEWIWSPSNEYCQPEMVSAQQLPWAVPTIQRLWFGTAYEDKQRRMKAFLCIMRSDSPLMLNRGYVPQHMLVMACVLRYIITNPDRNILTRQELDAFLATAFSPQLPMVEYTQDLVLPGVHLRGVYLATLFMQGVETASLANDACGVPLPWTMTNPWLFFDGKLFHLKLKLSTCVTTLRELCDDHIEIVLKIERFRKAILEDVEHFLLPAAHIDPMYRPGFLPPPLPLAYNTKSATTLPSLAATAAAVAAAGNNGTIFYNSQTPYFTLSPALLGRDSITGVNASANLGRNNGNRAIAGGSAQQRNMNTAVANRKAFHQLKVGGIVTGSWATNGSAAAATASRTIFGPPGNKLGNHFTNNLARLRAQNRNKNSVQTRLQRVTTHQSNSFGGSVGGGVAARSISRIYGNKLNTRYRNRQKRKENRKGGNNKKEQKDKKEETTEDVEATAAPTTEATSSGLTTLGASNTVATTSVASTSAVENNNVDNDVEQQQQLSKTDINHVSDKVKELSLRECTVELQNGRA